MKGFGWVCGVLLAVVLSWPQAARAEDGYDLWLRYRPLPSQEAGAYRAAASAVVVLGQSPTLQAARASCEGSGR